MSAGDEWANDPEPSRGWGCWPRLALLAAALVALAVLAGCFGSTKATVPTIQAPPGPAAGVQPQPPATAVGQSAVQVRS